MTPMQTTPPSPFNAFNAQQPQVQNPFMQTAGGGFGVGQQPPQNPFMGGQVDTGMNYTPGVQQPQQLSGNTMGGTGFGFQSTIPPYMPPNVQQQQMAQQAAQQQALQQALQQAQFMAQAPQQLGGQANPVLAQIEQAQMAQRTIGGPMQGSQQIQQTPLGLAALLGGQPRPAPAMAPNPGKPFQPPQQVAPRPAPAAVRPSPAPSQVPPRTPPAVANAIRGLAAKNPMGLR